MPILAAGVIAAFNQTQAFYLATALKLKEAGLSVPHICDCSLNSKNPRVVN